jgi:hypothetical protein
MLWDQFILLPRLPISPPVLRMIVILRARGRTIIRMPHFCRMIDWMIDMPIVTPSIVAPSIDHLRMTIIAAIIR